MKNRENWSGQLAFVLASSAAAIGLGNLWRFPYLAAKYGGGMFIVIYLGLVATLGFTLMISEIAIGRKTQQSQLTAFSRLRRGWGFVGIIGTVVPFLITPYYCVIGGWVVKYFVTYCQMAFGGTMPMGEAAADSGAFFGAFVSANLAPFGYGALFVLACATVVVLGVRNGLERSNLFIMPMLLALAIALAVYVICLPGTGGGLRYYLVPSKSALCDASGAFSFAQLGRTFLGAMGQMFYSLSLGMGITVTYGSYMNKSDSIERSARRIEFFDTLIAVVAGLMIIPVVYMFAVKTGTPVKEAMSAGPGLIFMTLPKVFAMLGWVGPWVGLAFFALVIVAALSSAIALYEACVAPICDFLHVERRLATFYAGAIILFLSSFSALGYGIWADVRIFGLQFLDFFDFITNSVMMPIFAVATCVLIGWVLKPGAIVDEVESEGNRFVAKKLYRFMVRYFAPILMTAILVSEVCRAFNIGGWSI